jgi:hypothetical protein
MGFYVRKAIRLGPDLTMTEIESASTAAFQYFGVTFSVAAAVRGAPTRSARSVLSRRKSVVIIKALQLGGKKKAG